MTEEGILETFVKSIQMRENKKEWIVMQEKVLKEHLCEKKACALSIIGWKREKKIRKIKKMKREKERKENSKFVRDF